MGDKQEQILAVITTGRDKVLKSGAPVFLAEDQQEQERLALLLAKILLGMPHDLENGVFVIVRH